MTTFDPKIEQMIKFNLCSLTYSQRNQPKVANSMAIALPIPLLPPVTKEHLLEKMSFRKTDDANRVLLDILYRPLCLSSRVS